MEFRCTYPSKVCKNPRVVRPNGKLHSFCEEHRLKANETQKRWYTRHRQTSTATETLEALTTSLHHAPHRPRRTRTHKVSKTVSQRYGRETSQTTSSEARTPSPAPTSHPYASTQARSYESYEFEQYHPRHVTSHYDHGPYMDVYESHQPRSMNPRRVYAAYPPRHTNAHRAYEEYPSRNVRYQDTLDEYHSTSWESEDVDLDFAWV